MFLAFPLTLVDIFLWQYNQESKLQSKELFFQHTERSFWRWGHFQASYHPGEEDFILSLISFKNLHNIEAIKIILNGKAGAEHSGNYSCSVPSLLSTPVRIHILNSEYSSSDH